MINKLILKVYTRDVLCMLSFVPVIFFMSLVLSDACYSREINGRQESSFLKNNFSSLVTRAYDSIPFTIQKIDHQNIVRYLIHGWLFLSDKKISISLDDSILLNYKKWVMSPGGRISFTPGGILLNGFSLSNDSASISLSGQQGLPGRPIEASIRNVEIGDITGFTGMDSLPASGLLDAKILLSEFGKSFPACTATGLIKNFAWMGQPVGNLQLDAQLPDKNTIHTALTLADNGNEVTATGNIFLNNPRQQFDILLDIKKLKMDMMPGLLPGKVSNASGSISGLVALKGKLAQPGWKGYLNFDTTKFTLHQLGATYSISNQKVLLDYPAISVNQFTIKDSLENSLTINGNMYSKTFKAFDFDLRLNSQDFTLINAPKAINNQVYGYVGVDANITVAGSTVKPVIAGDIYLNKKTGVTLVVPEKNIDRDAARSVVRFIDRDTFALPEKEAFKPAAEPKADITPYLFHNLNIRSDKMAALTIIIDPSTGDELKVQGDARLNAGVNAGGNFLLAGTYLLDSGYYELNYQFLKKRFKVMPGSTIYFGGDPLDAQINMRAEYIANTAPKDLLGNEVGSVSASIAQSFKQNIPFRVVLFLKGSLKKPAISFDIRLPSEGAINSRLRTTIENKLVQLRADVAATNKQVFALLGLDRFVGEQSTDFFKGNGGDFSDIAKESVSKFLSAALDQIASDLFKGINLDLNQNSYRDFVTSKGVEKTDLNVEVSKNFLNDRLSVTVGKNFGIEGQDGSAKAAQQKGSRFLPDVTVNYKLSTNGKYMIRSYTKNPFEVILDGYVMETGVAFIVTMDYELFKDLLINK